MIRTVVVTAPAALLALLAGCGTAPAPGETGPRHVLPPSETLGIPSARAQSTPTSSAAPDTTTLPIGVGLTASPGSFLIGGALDFALDEKLTAGPAVQLGLGDKTDLFAAFGQVKYWLLDDPQTVNPFLQAGLGVAYLDREGRGNDWSPLINMGGGVRLLTGEHYRIGSTALVNFTTSDPADTSVYLSWEIVQIVLDF
jgi:hypothetical protein